MMSEHTSDVFSALSLEQNKCVRGQSYFFLIVYNYNMMTWVYYLKERATAFEKSLTMVVAAGEGGTSSDRSRGEFLPNEFDQNIHMQVTDLCTIHQNRIMKQRISDAKMLCNIFYVSSVFHL